MPDFDLFWGDLHNHNQIGYAQGSLERSYEIARSHLDFYAFTPHGMHADGGAPEGFPVTVKNWARVQRAAAENNRAGEFTCFLGYEWHSNDWGHVHVIYFDDHEPMRTAPTLAELQDDFRGRNAILVPHHIAYGSEVDPSAARGQVIPSGVDWQLFDESLSPVVEIYSEHGCSERDVGLFPMVGHSGGPGPSRFTAQHGLSLGNKFGFTAGTDNHDGYPGGYGLGLTGVLASANTRRDIAGALRARRTMAVTGDRIEFDFRAGDHYMGDVLPPGQAPDLTFGVKGWDIIKQVEVVRNNVPVLVQTPDYQTKPSAGEMVYRLRLEWGWGPMKGYQLYDWTGSIHVGGGALERVVPAFSSDPFDEQRRKQILEQDANGCRWRSHTSRGGVFTTRNGLDSCSANDALCLEIRGTPETKIDLALDCETNKSLLATTTDWSISTRYGSQKRSFTLGELIQGRQGFSMGEVPTWAVVHRAVPESLFRLQGGFAHQPGTEACYYLRVTQENGQMAWASPVWYET